MRGCVKPNCVSRRRRLRQQISATGRQVSRHGDQVVSLSLSCECAHASWHQGVQGEALVPQGSFSAPGLELIFITIVQFQSGEEANFLEPFGFGSDKLDLWRPPGRGASKDVFSDLPGRNEKKIKLVDGQEEADPEWTQFELMAADYSQAWC